MDTQLVMSRKPSFRTSDWWQSNRRIAVGVRDREVPLRQRTGGPNARPLWRGPARTRQHARPTPWLAALQAVAHALQAKDPYTAGHSLRVSVFARVIAERLGLSTDHVKTVALAAELHDVGKIGVPERLLHKEGRLTLGEYHQIMQHTVLGEEILAPVLGDYPEILRAVRSHHERIDGRGSPDGLSGEDIPLAARIIGVADSFDAMTSDRPYRRAMSVSVALAELRRNRGAQFDGACVDVLCQVVESAAG